VAAVFFHEYFGLPVRVVRSVQTSEVCDYQRHLPLEVEPASDPRSDERNERQDNHAHGISCQAHRFNRLEISAQSYNMRQLLVNAQPDM
jgi:hypothetical protein